MQPLSPLHIAYQPSAEDGLGRLIRTPWAQLHFHAIFAFSYLGLLTLKSIWSVPTIKSFKKPLPPTCLSLFPPPPNCVKPSRADMGLPPCTILTHFPQAPKRTPLLLLNSNLGDTLQYLAAYGYYPSFEVRHYLRCIHAAKEPLLARLERANGVRDLRNSGPRNRCFFILEHLESH